MQAKTPTKARKGWHDKARESSKRVQHCCPAGGAVGGGGGEAPQDAQEGHCGDGFQWKVIGGLLLVSSLSSTPTIPYDLNEYSKIK